MLSLLDTEEQTPEQARLYEACLKGSREDIRKYVSQGALASQHIKDGMNPMHVVAVAGRADAEAILTVLLESGLPVDAPTAGGGDTVLHLVVEHVEVQQAFPLVLKILEYGPDLSIRNRKLRTAYDIAVARGEFELAAVLDGSMTAQEARQFYTDKIAALYGRRDRKLSARTKRLLQARLVDAVLRSNEQEIADFLKLGADPNYVNEHKNGSIHYAITHCTLPPQRTLKLLIDGDADVNLTDDEGDTALNLVIKSSRLRDNGDMRTCCELLVQNGALSTSKDLDGNDALALATKRGYDDIVQLLTSNRGRHVQEPRSRPSFQLPVPEESDEDGEEAEAPPNPVNEQEALVRACREGTLADVNEALFTLRADPNIPDDTGLYALHHVLIRGEFEDEEERLDMLRSLIESAADINIKTVNSESSALHVAATKNQDHCAQLLLDTHKCDYNAKNKHGKTAYEVAEEEECREVMDVIENHRRKVRDGMQKAAKASTCTII
ncbi:ankyrin repeat domain-containing protein 50-like isoform X5 [Mya arenaria]|uniref:ankyrin repeat domain-containing protein 50-like isoform X5 n=1 Tax=Mya arenaria TaxID=6604 RepID=UPI0022E9274F|nr:ankyrin repeat domain-containing protein 50-like isoform X5 [Mya arenaria]